jgi:alkylation response protein AidB-like acyl-CoA dehydrogenase
MDELLGEVRRFAAREVAPLALDRAGSIPPHVLEGLRALGLFGLTLPAQYGGAGLGLTEACAVVSALAEVDRSVAVTLGLHLGLGTRGLVEYGSAPLKHRTLPELASGRRIAAFCATEPGAGSDLSQLATRLSPRASGFSLTGQKAYVTNGALAGVLTVVAQEPTATGTGRTRLAVVDPGSRGVSIGAEEKKLGLKASSTTPIFFDQVELPADALLGEPDAGPAQLAQVLCWGRLLMSAGCVGAARAALGRAVAHVAERRQFKRPLAAQEVVQQRLGAMAARLFAMRALVSEAARAPTPEALVALSTSAKLFCSEGAFALCDGALQLFGGAGYLEDTGLALLLRDTRVTRIFEGANDVLWTHRGALLATAAPGWGAKTAPGRAQKAASALREVLVTEHALRLLGKKEALHRLGVAAMWADASAAAWRAAQTPQTRALAEAVEGQAMDGIALALKPDTQHCGEACWSAALAAEWL